MQQPSPNTKKCVDQGNEWKFIPNRAPWLGGFLEQLNNRPITSVSTYIKDLEPLTPIGTKYDSVAFEDLHVKLN